MTRVRPYLPLLGFVLPTVVVGYGFVIPRSCIAGVNELTIGFGTTIFGAVLTYFAGQRAVAPRVCTKPPLGVRIARAINRQASSPSGLFGRLLGAIWRSQHARLNGEALDWLDVRPGQHVLEIGSGPGEALREAARRAPGGHVVGVDVSDAMVRMACARNRDALARGVVDVRLGDGTTLPLDGETFDRVVSVHAIYFWRDLAGTLAQVAAALAPDGALLLVFRPDGDDIPARFRDPTYRFPRVEQLELALKKVGLDRVEVRPSESSPGVVFVSARRA
jgi:SAM-dependent methyltransferase